MPPLIRTIRLSKSDFCHAPSKIMFCLEKQVADREADLLATCEMPVDKARRLFQDGLELCDRIEADYKRSMAGTLAAAIDTSYVKAEEIERGLMRTGFQLIDPNFKTGSDA